MGHLTYIHSIFLGFLLGVILFILAVVYQIGVPTESSRWIAEIYQIKNKIASSIEQPKIVVVAGSNALFGISCEMISQEMNTPCLNGGTHAGLGVDYVLETSKKWVKPKDLVLLPLEYVHYTNRQEMPSLLVDYVFSRDINYLFSVDVFRKIQLFTGMSLDRLDKGIRTRFVPNQQWKAFYNSKNLNNYGDETSNLKTKITKKENKALDSVKTEF